MTLNALVFVESPNSSASVTLLEACRTANFQVQAAECPSLENFSSSLPLQPTVLLLPALEADCRGIKLAQLAQASDAAHEVLLYGQRLPNPAYIAQALQEGVRQVLELQGNPDTLLCQLRRALSSAESTWTERAKVAQTLAQLKEQQEQLEVATRTIQRLDERCAALSRTALSLATGRLNLNESCPTLIVVSASTARCAEACAVAESMGFQTSQATSASACLELLNDSPPDLLLCDGEMSDMDATLFSRKARTALGRQPITIIAWSAGPKAAERLLGQPGGVDDLVAKGADPSSEVAAALLLGLEQSSYAASKL